MRILISLNLRMLQDLGGFKKLDLKSAKMRILDLDAEKRQQEESAAAATSPITEMSKGGVPDPSTTGLLGGMCFLLILSLCFILISKFVIT